MKSLKQLVKEFADQGYPNPLIHAECKLWALQKQALANQQAPPTLKPAFIKNFEKALQGFVRTYVKNGGYITQYPEKQIRKSNKKVAMPQEPVIRFNSRHKLTPEEDSQLRMLLGVA